MVPRNARIQLFPYICQHDPRWFPEPEVFDPARFLPEHQSTLPQFAYIPFDGGPRVCIGNTFAIMEMTLVAATLLQNLKVGLAVGQGTAKPVALMSLPPKGGVRLWWTRRNVQDAALNLDTRLPRGQRSDVGRQMTDCNAQ
jgi:cytochrome P450